MENSTENRKLSRHNNADFMEKERPTAQGEEMEGEKTSSGGNQPSVQTFKVSESTRENMHAQSKSAHAYFS